MVLSFQKIGRYSRVLTHRQSVLFFFSLTGFSLSFSMAFFSNGVKVSRSLPKRAKLQVRTGGCITMMHFFAGELSNLYNWFGCVHAILPLYTVYKAGVPKPYSFKGYNWG